MQTSVTLAASGVVLLASFTSPWPSRGRTTSTCRSTMSHFLAASVYWRRLSPRICSEREQRI